MTSNKLLVTHLTTEGPRVTVKTLNRWCGPGTEPPKPTLTETVVPSSTALLMESEPVMTKQPGASDVHRMEGDSGLLSPGGVGSGRDLVSQR